MLTSVSVTPGGTVRVIVPPPAPSEANAGAGIAGKRAGDVRVAVVVRVPALGMRTLRLYVPGVGGATKSVKPSVNPTNPGG